MNKIFKPKESFLKLGGNNGSMSTTASANGVKLAVRRGGAGIGDVTNNENGSRQRSRTSFQEDTLQTSTSSAATVSLPRDIPQWSPFIPKPIVVKNYFPGDLNGDFWSEDGALGGGTTITPHGVISMRFHDRVRVDVSLDRAVRIVNTKNHIVLALNSSGSSAALVHPNGRVLQYGSRVEILAHNSQGNNKYAKMWYKGVSFTSDNCALVYLVDSAGTRTTTDSFTDLSGDISLHVFYDRVNTLDSSPGSHLIDEALNALQHATYWVSEDRTDNWIINNVRISQTTDGLVRVVRNSNKFSLRTSPSNGSASVSSPYLHCTGSMGQTRHLFVRRGERRMHYDGTTFIVRNAGHSAGFDERHQLKVY